jgi:hypothetical protein
MLSWRRILTLVPPGNVSPCTLVSAYQSTRRRIPYYLKILPITFFNFQWYLEIKSCSKRDSYLAVAELESGSEYRPPLF